MTRGAKPDIANQLSTEQLLQILNSLGAYVYLKDKNFRYTYVNQLVAELFHRPIEDIIGLDDEDLFGQETAENLVRNADSQVINEGKELEAEEVNYIPEQDSYRTYLSVKKPLLGPQGSVDGLIGISTDITRYKEIERKIRLSEQKLNTVLDNVGAHIYIRDLDSNFLYVNKLTADLFGKQYDEIVGQPLEQVIGEQAAEEFRQLDNELFASKDKVEGVETFSGDDGELFYYWTVKVPLYDDEGNITSFIGISSDITAQKKLEVELAESNARLEEKIQEITHLQTTLWEQATRDPLTQLYNRRYFNDYARKEISRIKRSHQPMALIMIDADHFKKVNDNLGHDMGDQALIHLADIMISHCRESDIVCRFGGEEFLIMMPGVNVDSAITRAEEIRQAYQSSSPKILAGTESTISAGIALWSSRMTTLEDLTKAADQALYSAKKNGRNRVEVATNSDDHS